MKRRGRSQRQQKPQPKKIHVAWPSVCSVELQQCCDILNAILGRLNHHGDRDALVVSLRAAISSAKEAQQALDEAYGK
jgi:hypothetical protein